MIETDGPYEGAKCSSTEHAHHQGEDDSVWTQYERNMEFYEWCKARGMYIHVRELPLCPAILFDCRLSAVSPEAVGRRPPILTTCAVRASPLHASVRAQDHHAEPRMPRCAFCRDQQRRDGL